MLDIKDVAGLSKPLTRLVEVVAEGIGAVCQPWLIRKNADAKAYEIRTIAKAIEDSPKLPGTMKYEDGVICIEASTCAEPQVLQDMSLDQRVIMRMAYQEAKKQSNIEQVIQRSYEELRDDEQEIPSERPQSDWITRFFRIAEDISTDQMQTLWGKILAGEVKKPGSYSLRTLDLLKNITHKEAELFVRVCKVSFLNNETIFVPNQDNGKYLEEHFGLQLRYFLLLQEIGLLVADGTLRFSIKPTTQDRQEVFICGNTCVFVDRLAGMPKQLINAHVFTQIGKELFQLIDKTPADPDYIKKFASYFRRKGVSIRSGLIVEWQGTIFKCINLLEIPDETN